MDLLNISCGIATIASFGLALFEMFRSAKNRVAETSKSELELERIRHSKHNVMACAETINMVVQRTKESDVSREELANLARVARAQLVIIANTLSKEEERLSHWKYGQLFMSARPAHVNEQPMAKSEETQEERMADD